MPVLNRMPQTPQLPGAASVMSRNVPGSLGAGGGAKRRPMRANSGNGAAASLQPADAAQPQQAQGPPTFAELQQSGRARPAPPTPMMARPQPSAGVSASQGPNGSPLRSQLASSLRSSLANPNPYNSQTVQSIDSALTGQLTQDFGAKRKMLEEDLARRGLSASTFGGGYYGDLQGQENQALATMRAGLTQSAANAELAGRTQAQTAAQANLNAENQSGLSQQQLELQRTLGLGNLDLQAGSLTGNVDGQSTLGARQLEQSGSQFGQTLNLSQQQQDLARLLGLGNLGINQEQLGLQRTGQAQDYELGRGSLDLQRTGQEQQFGLAKEGQQTQREQFGQQLDLSQQQQELARLLGQGGLDLQRTGQAQDYELGRGGLDLQRTGQEQQYGLARRGQDIQEGQFGQQLGLSQQQQDLARQLGLGNLDLARTGQAQDYGLAKNAQDINQQQFGVTSDLNRGQLDLSKALGFGNLDLARTDQAQQFGLAKNAQDINQQQFGVNTDLSRNAQNIQQQQFGQTMGLSREQQDLARQLGLGNLDVSNRQLTQQGSQFGQDLALRTKQGDQQYGLQSQAQNDARQQFAQSLAQQLGIATMGDRTANRGIDANASSQQLDFLMKLAGLGGFDAINDYAKGGSPTPTTPTTPTKPTVDEFYKAWERTNPGRQAPSPTSKEGSDWWTAYQQQQNKPGSQTGATTTVNFGGKQYTQQEFDQLKKNFPELFGVKGPPQQDLSGYDKPQKFVDPNSWKQYEVPEDTRVDPYNQAFRGQSIADQNAQVEKDNWQQAQRDAASNLQNMIQAGGMFTDTSPKGQTVGGDYSKGMGSTQDFINAELAKAGFNPDGTRSDAWLKENRRTK